MRGNKQGEKLKKMASATTSVVLQYFDAENEQLLCHLWK